MTTLLIILVVAFGAMAIAQLARVYELTSKLRGTREEEISDSDNRMNARLMWLFCVAYFAFFFWLLIEYSDQLLPVPASMHGVWIENLMFWNWVVLFIVFFITNTVLFWFAGKYYMRKGRQAFWYPHNNTLEIWWTVVPAVVMIGIIIYGLITWNRIVAPAHPDTLVMELYAKQFDWTARYPGKDGRLGATDYRLINATNPLGIVTTTSVKTRLEEIAKEKAEIEAKLAKEVLPEDKQAELRERVEHLERTVTRIVHLRTIMEQDIAANGGSSQYLHGSDDIVTKEFHLPVRKEVSMVIRSRDVIHSMFLPHLRAQMNAVPGMATTFRMTPTITTDSMRTVLNDPAFDYILMCNKICGASHYNMQMPLTVEPLTAYETWMAGQLKNPFEGAPTADAPAPSAPPDSTRAVPTATAQAVTPAKP